MKATAYTTQNMDRTKKIIFTALFAALTCVGTMIIKIPTPTNGYIHPGDGFVLLSGLILGPIWGAFAAGLGSALSDFIGGYFIYVPATFIIKALTAFVGYHIFKLLQKVFTSGNVVPQLAMVGVVGEAVMVLGYFLFEIFTLSVLNDSSVAAATVAAAASIIPNIVQGVFGVIIATILYPILNKKLP